MSKDISFHTNQEYKSLIQNIKNSIRNSRLKAALSVNQEVIKLYWSIGKQLIDKQKETSWGSKLIESVANDLQAEFPETAGFSTTNIKRMKQFAVAYPDLEIGAQSVPQLPWGHIIQLMQKVKAYEVREWYAKIALEEGWSRVTLELNIKKDLYSRQAIPDNKTSNYQLQLPSPQSELAQEILKQPYNFDFLGLHDQALEREIEHAATKHITKFLLELGKGFAFVGRQVPLALNDKQYFIDMLFYNLKLRSYVVIEFKATDFKPEHAGQLNFYLNLVDDLYKSEHDQPSIGLLLCKSRDKFEAEYALKGINKPIGVSEYELTKAIPENLRSNLPSIQEIENELKDIEPDEDE